MLQYDNLIEEFKSGKNPFKKYSVNKYPNKKRIRQMQIFFQLCNKDEKRVMQEGNGKILLQEQLVYNSLLQFFQINFLHVKN